jgi:hypothetical protein
VSKTRVTALMALRSIRGTLGSQWKKITVDARLFPG